MKFDVLTASICFVSMVAAVPTAVVERQLFGGGMFEISKGGCKKVSLVWARGTTEAVNIGSFVGYPLLSVLKKNGMTDLAVEGVTYGAGLTTNVLSPGGADSDGVRDAARLFKLAAQKCPQTIIIGGGYSQGAAIMHRAAKGLPKEVENRIAGIALFGDTQNYQSKGHIVGFPQEKSKVFCEAADGVCNGLLNVNAGHLSYSGTNLRGEYTNAKLLEGAAWLKSRVDGFKDE